MADLAGCAAGCLNTAGRGGIAKDRATMDTPAGALPDNTIQRARISRTRLNIIFYRNYAGLDCRAVRECVEPCFEAVLRPNVFGEASRCIREHQAAGRRIVFAMSNGGTLCGRTSRRASIWSLWTSAL